MVILDDALQPIAQADMDHQDTLSLWCETTVKKNMQDILAHPEKTYVDHMTLNNVPYDMAATATDDGSRLILCYASTEKPASDPYELTIRSILTNNSFDKNPTLVIADGTQVLSTNSAIVDELGTTQYHQLASTIQWKDGVFTKFEYQHTTYYGLRRVYSSYYVYAVYAAEDIFTHRTAYLAFGFMAYLGVGIIILAIQRHYDKLSMNKMEKQLRIINAISTAYNSTFLLHTDNMTLEPMPERLKGKPFLGCEVKDCHDAWFSVMLIPQKFDGYGNIQALLITTRDITSVKQTEELSFKDKLTGLHNRNYMESRSKRFVRAGDLPVSLIMADCNYLKRTNDTLGHEYGDLLLQRVANVIQESVSPNDVAMRVGGDEFLILCTHCPNDQAHALVDRIRQKLAQRSDEHLTLSVSFGVSTVEGGEFSFDQAYEQADQAMYRDKQASRVQR
ncbi:MAG: GGDEF domain-containing protein [Lawsonibacter sp.]